MRRWQVFIDEVGGCKPYFISTTNWEVGYKFLGIKTGTTLAAACGGKAHYWWGWGRFDKPALPSVTLFGGTTQSKLEAAAPKDWVAQYTFGCDVASSPDMDKFTSLKQIQKNYVQVTLPCSSWQPHKGMPRPTNSCSALCSTRSSCPE